MADVIAEKPLQASTAANAKSRKVRENAGLIRLEVLLKLLKSGRLEILEKIHCRGSRMRETYSILDREVIGSLAERRCVRRRRQGEREGVDADARSEGESTRRG